jgi:hypothetical protein
MEEKQEGLCPSCKSKLKHQYVERENGAGDYINEYHVVRCSNSECDYGLEECIGGHCNPAWCMD